MVTGKGWLYSICPLLEGGQVDKVTNENLQSSGPLWYTVNHQFEEYLSSAPTLRHLKGLKDVKFCQ
jgi:hypothetical protein